MGVAVVGIGYFGSLHAQAYARLPECELIAVVDPDPATAPLAEWLGVPRLDHVDELPDSVQTVSVATPVGTHYKLTKRLLQRGLDVLLEKPIAETPRQAKELCRLAARHRRVLQIGHIERFNPAFALGPSLLPRARTIDMVRTTQRPPRGDWLNVVMDLMIHDLDLILFGVTSHVVRFHATGGSLGMTAIDSACVELHFGNGCVARLTSHWGATVAINDRRMFAELDTGETWAMDFLRREAYRTRSAASYTQDLPMPPLGIPADTLSLQLASFVRASQQRATPHVTPEHGYAALDLARKIQERILGQAS
ncbi:Gfo/Idh/MocA family protein [Dyella subtropica]|uniref:Gfo/Idh/MocA family protein n=1 Tax=Dyella subtropica TaxID=2992127 RepID=UPI0022517E48|nr:Gfo/Idh/MocA family oxidoreductase [Dyella subtropica]